MKARGRQRAHGPVFDPRLGVPAGRLPPGLAIPGETTEALVIDLGLASCPDRPPLSNRSAAGENGLTPRFLSPNPQQAEGHGHVAEIQVYDDVVVGAGILGLAHAYELGRRGRRVIVLERDPGARGASVRNFGMLWPIGQPVGDRRALAKRSRDIWLNVLASSGLWFDPAGSLHLAYRDDEAQVLREFAAENQERGEPVRLLDAPEAGRRAPAVRREGLQLALWSGEEVCVDPREVVAGLPAWLSRQHRVRFQFDAPITALELPTFHAGGIAYSADRAWVCSGDELRMLFPDLLRRCGLIRCKLQMMRSQPDGDPPRIGLMLAAGLTLRHYDSFRNCPSLPALKERVARESPWLDRYGIHVLVAQNGRGELTIGDSHEYGDTIDPFNRAEIDEWILGYLKTFLHAPGLRIASRWHGTYAKHPTEPYLILRPLPRVTVVTGLGGAGMTLSFGLAEQVVSRELDS
jgi:FAD dependent oxidoreductase TIGR03364